MSETKAQITRPDVEGLRELRRKAPAKHFNWDGLKRSQEDDGEGGIEEYVFIPECSYLGNTMIAMAGDYEDNGWDGLYVQEAANRVPELLDYILHLEEKLAARPAYRDGEYNVHEGIRLAVDETGVFVNEYLNEKIYELANDVEAVLEEPEPPTCILTGAPGEDPEDCTTHTHEGEECGCADQVDEQIQVPGGGSYTTQRLQPCGSCQEAQDE